MAVVEQPPKPDLAGVEQSHGYDFVTLTNAVFIGRQLRPESFAFLQAKGISVVLNHRPDDEEGGQPTSQELAEAASAVGVRYLHFPVAGLPNSDAISATAAAVQGLGTSQKMLMFCKSGLRSAAVWAMAEVGAGRLTPEDARQSAARAGFDLSRIPL